MSDPIPASEAQTEAVFRALSNPTRRRVLDLIAAGPRTTGAIAAEFPISRVAVMKHLRALREAGLVLDRRRGRERWHHLNLVPLQTIRERWFQPREERWAASLVRLRELAEGGGPVSGLCLDVAQEVRIDAAPERVFEALTADVSGWWGHPYLNPAATSLALEPRLGGELRERWGRSGGALLATVSAIDPPRLVELTGPLHMGVVFGVARFEIEATDGGTVLRFSHRAVGELEPVRAERFAGGWAELVGSRLKAYAESGEPIPFAGPDPGPKRSKPRKRRKR